MRDRGTVGHGVGFPALRPAESAGRPRRAARGAAALVGLALVVLLLAGCSTPPAMPLTGGAPVAAAPPTPPPTPRVVLPPPIERPIAAHDLAGRMGMSYRDAGDHVLLEDRTTRVRIWKDSTRVSVAGRETVLKNRTLRRGRSLEVPGSTATWVQREVTEQRARFEELRVAALPPPAPPPARRTPRKTGARLPVDPAPEPEPARGGAALAVPRAVPAAWTPWASPRAWRWIVIHHSDDTSGNLAKYDRIHREQNGWDECGYHFVIGNGSQSGDGEVEVGPRWPKQKWGAHCKTADNCYNDFGIGICLVGDFHTQGRPSAAQMESLVALCRHLMATYHIPAEMVVGHSDCKATDCPGRYFPMAELRARLR